ncbi:MAG: prepilin-type N-terminal cleavage/methylation domain-containing protein [Kiritimatiellae bacterium]|nr:prepilin-type N-terminal cleavage/methylation domain-containing protein [Kiritimatiellia bacterium]
MIFRRRVCGRQGFTLIEIALALLVISIGVLGAFSLFPHGLAEAQMASFETQAGLIGEMIFRSYRALAVTQSWNSINSSLRVRVPGVEPGIWSGSSTTAEIFPDGAVRELVMAANIPAATGGTGETIDHAMRYRLIIEDRVPQRLKRFTLYLWPGRYGSTDPSLARIYVTEIYNIRMQ